MLLAAKIWLRFLARIAVQVQQHRTEQHCTHSYAKTSKHQARLDSKEVRSSAPSCVNMQLCFLQLSVYQTVRAKGSNQMAETAQQPLLPEYWFVKMMQGTGLNALQVRLLRRAGVTLRSVSWMLWEMEIADTQSLEEPHEGFSIYLPAGQDLTSLLTSCNVHSS